MYVYLYVDLVRRGISFWFSWVLMVMLVMITLSDQCRTCSGFPFDFLGSNCDGGDKDD
jgi:hypothetical protein